MTLKLKLCSTHVRYVYDMYSIQTELEILIKATSYKSYFKDKLSP